MRLTSIYTRILSALAVVLFFAAPGALAQEYAPASSKPGTDEPTTAITADLIQQAQQKWVAALVSIGTAQAEGRDAAARAAEVLDRYYDFSGAGVVFKPTLTHGEQTFRLTRDGALAYFVGGDEAFPNDSGFALTGYVDGMVDFGGYVIHNDIALAVSNITLVAQDGSTVTVNKTFGYRLDDEGRLRIIAHHSSLPFVPAEG